MSDIEHDEDNPPGEEAVLEIIEEALSQEFDNPESIPILENALMSATRLMMVMDEFNDTTLKIDEKVGTLLLRLGMAYEDIDENQAIFYNEKRLEHSERRNDEDGVHLSLIRLAHIYTKMEPTDIPNLRRICDLYDSFELGGTTIWDGYKAIVESEEAIQNMETSSSSECFIATAAYGTPFDPKIDVLRNWRDESLRHFSFGRLFIRFYYFASPPIADIVAKSELLRWFVRRLISPAIFLLKPRHGITR
jgi:hypothetical protein